MNEYTLMDETLKWFDNGSHSSYMKFSIECAKKKQYSRESLIEAFDLIFPKVKEHRVKI